MAIDIRIKGDESIPEYEDAQQLREIFQKNFKESDEGDILIYAGATLFGQEVRDIDLIVLGKLKRHKEELKSKAVSRDEKKIRVTHEMKMRSVYVNSFCFVIETKRHPASSIQVSGLNLLVKYGNKMSDATTQSERQKYSLKKFFENNLNYSPFICNFIWLKNVAREDLSSMLEGNENTKFNHNLLPSSFSFRYLMQLACIQIPPYAQMSRDAGKVADNCSFDSFKKGISIDFDKIEDSFQLFEKVKGGIGELSRQKLEQISKRILRDQEYSKAIGEKLVVISGRSGTGKTVKLLSIAHDLVKQQDARCLILTFNHALVSDILRNVALLGISDDVEKATIHVSTLHKYFYDLILGFGLSESIREKYVPIFIKNYKSYIEEIYEYIREGLLGKNEYQDVMKRNHDTLSWDFILIDEGQDWSELEKEILVKLFGKEKMIVADGIDQLIRSQHPCNWVSGMSKEIDYRKTIEKRCLRQKINLVEFVNAFASSLGLSWNLEKKEELTGGKVIIKMGDYSKELHEKEFANCKSLGNTAYEMMFLVPPNLVLKEYEEREVEEQEHEEKEVEELSINTEKSKKREIKRYFKDTENFEIMGIPIWDGTRTDLRTEYVVNLDQHRLLQYESCRGLEAWAVVCMNFDDFVKNKQQTFKVEEFTGKQESLESFEEKRDKHVNLWSLIPLTRAVDTLVITLRDPTSETASLLRKLYEKNKDFVEWIS